MTTPIVLINLFEVPQEGKQDFVVWWERCTDALKHEPGFLDATLHTCLRENARYAFINVAHWESPESLQRASAKHQDVLQAIPVGGKGNPALYTVASERLHS